MKKRILCRALIGAPIGLAISTAITIFSSLIYGDGNYYPVVPALVEQCGNCYTELFDQADRAMYAIKRSGKSNYAFAGNVKKKVKEMRARKRES